MIHRLFVQVNPQNRRRIAHISPALIYRSFSGQEMICPFLLTGKKRFSIFHSLICNGRYYLFATIKIMKHPDAR